MNIFYLDSDPVECAKQHCDKHVVKMIIEYAQLLCTAHRIIDGEMYVGKTKTGRNVKRWLLKGTREESLYKASHVNHPSAVWARACMKNYMWLFKLFAACCDEYTHRYGKVHLTDQKFRRILRAPPNNIALTELTEIPQAMPDHCKMPSPIDAYRKYYVVEKQRFAKWTNRQTPEWFLNETSRLSDSNSNDQRVAI